MLRTSLRAGRRDTAPSRWAQVSGVAANVCGVTVGVIAEQQPAAVNCEAAVMQDLPVAFRQ